jgi:hypothetical protein
VSTFPRHSVSNDDATCQANFGDTSPVGVFDFSKAPFRSLRKVLTSSTKAVTFVSIVQRDSAIPPSISSGLAPMILASNSPLVQGGRLPTQTIGSVTRQPRNDSGLPT